MNDIALNSLAMGLARAESRIDDMHRELVELQRDNLELSRRLTLGGIAPVEPQDRLFPNREHTQHSTGDAHLDQQIREHRGLFARPLPPFGTIDVEVDPLPTRFETRANSEVT